MSNDITKSPVFCWNELMTPDTKKAQDFYTNLLGWQTKAHDMGDMTYTLFMANDQGIAGMLQTPKEQQDKIPPHWMSYISVDHLEATLEKAQSLGASIKVPITVVPDMGRFALIIDPTGAHIAFWQAGV